MSGQNNATDNSLQKDLGLDKEAGSGSKRWWWWGGVVILALAVAAWYFLGGNGNGNGKAAINYQTVPIEKGDLTVKVTATGTLTPINQVDVSSELSGIIKKVNVDYNNKVAKGQILAELDTSKLSAKVKQSEAALASARAGLLTAKATLKETRNNLARLQQLHKMSGGKLPSRNDLEGAEASLLRANAGVASAEADIAKAAADLLVNQTDLAKAEIKSPINGVVLVRSVEPGQTVAASLSAPVLFTVAEDLSQMELTVNVDEADVGLVREGQPAEFTVDAFPNRTFQAKITQVRFGPQTVNGVVTYQAILSLNNSDLALRPGMTATADITVRKIVDSILIPNAAMRFKPKVTRPKPVGGLFRRLLGAPPRPANTKPKKTAPKDKNRKLIWLLVDGHPKAAGVIVGLSDGAKTEVKRGRVKPGDKVIIGITRKAK